MRWGAGAGRLAADLGQHGAAPAAGGSAWPRSRATRRRCCSAPATSPTPARSRRWPGAARSSSPTSSTTPASSTAAGSRRAETFVYRHGDLEHLAWGLREAGGRGCADRHRRRLLDGRRRRAAGRSWLRAGPPPRLPADGRRGPRHRRARARAGAARSPPPGSAARSTSSSAPSARRSAPTAPTSAPSAEIDRLPASTRARPFIFSTAPPPPVGRRRRWRRWSCSKPSPRGSSGCSANAAALRDGARRRGPRAPATRETQIVPVEVGDAERDDGALRARCSSAASSPRGSARRPCPRAPRACASR